MEVLHPRWWVSALLLLFAGGAHSEELAYIAAVTDVVSVVKPGGVVDDLIPVDGDTPLRRIAITPDGTRAFLIFPLRLSVLDLQTRQIVGSAPISGGTAVDSDVAFAPGGAVLYVADPITRKISIIDTATAEEPAVIDLGTAEPRKVAVTPDGTRLYVLCVHVEGGPHSEILAFDTTTRALITRAVIPDLARIEGDLAISPDGRFVYANAGFRDALYVLNTQTNTIEGPFSVGVSFSRFILSSDGRFAYALGVDGSATLPLVALIDLVSRTTVATIPLPQQTRYTGAPQRLQLSPDARRLYLLRPDACMLTVIDIAARAIVATVPLDEFATDLAVADVPQRDPTPSPTPTSPPGAGARHVCAYASVRDAGRVAVADVARHELGGFIPIGGPEAIALDPNTARAYIASAPLSGPARLAVVDTEMSSVMDQLDMGTQIQGLAVDSRGATLVAPLRSDCFGMAVLHLDTQRLNRLTALAGMSPFRIALRPDGAVAYVSEFSTNAIAVFDVSSGEVRSEVPLSGVGGDLVLTADGATLYVATFGQSPQPADSISVIDAAAQRVVGAVSLPSVPFALRLSPDGRKLYVTYGDFPGVNTGLAIIDTATLAVTVSVPLPNTGIALAVTPDGAAVYVAVTVLDPVPGQPPREEGRLMVLDATTAAEIAELRLDQPARHIEIAEVPGNCSAPPTPTRTATQTASASPTPSGTATPSPTPTPTRTTTPTSSPTVTPMLPPSFTPTPTPSRTRTPSSPTATATSTHSVTPVATATPLPTTAPEGDSGCSISSGPRRQSNSRAPVLLFGGLGLAFRRPWRRALRWKRAIL